MNGYVQVILDCYHHKSPNKPQLHPHKNTDISYESTVQYSAKADSIPPLNTLVIKRVQVIVGVLLYYAQAVDNNLIVDISAIGDQQASAIKYNLDAMTQLLDYVATYQNDDTTYRAEA